MESEQKKMTEIVELDYERKWAFLRQYYKAATAFYDVKDQVVSDDEIREHILKFKEKPRPRVRKEFTLKEWQFILDKEDEGVEKGFFLGEYDEGKWEKISVPHSCRYIPENPVMFGKACDPVYDMPKDDFLNIWRGDYTTWYKHRLTLNGIPSDCVSYIGFDSINLNSSVWINDVPVMMDHYGLFPYEIEITEELASGNSSEAVVAVKVDNITSNAPVMFSNGLQTAYVNEKYPQGGKIHYMHDDVFSGIAGDTVLSLRNRNHISSAFFITESISGNGADICCRVSLRNVTWRKFDGKVRIEIMKWLPEEGQNAQVAAQNVFSLPMGESSSDIRFSFANADLWDVDTPNLYLAHVILEDASGMPIDDVFESFGVRTIEVKGNQLFLNNKRITPRGSHDSSHYHGESMLFFSDEMIVKNILLHKKMGANCSRWPSDSKIHYKKLADYCDQMGYMVSWCGFFEMWKLHPQAELYASRDVPALVRSLRNNPSIIFWEMGDEPYLFTHPYNRIRWFEMIYKLVTVEDVSRPVVPSGGWCADLVDRIYSYQEEGGLSLDDSRAKVLAELPVYNSDLAVWDCHYVPFTSDKPKTCHYTVERVREAFGGKKFGVFTEWGFDGLPDPEKVKHIYNGFQWKTSPYLPWQRNKSDMGFFGRLIQQDDWREVQAGQAIVMSNLVWYIRECPEKIGAFYFLCAHDWSTCYYGVFDAERNCKLAFFAMQDCYNKIYISGLHGNTVIKTSDSIDIMASNIGEDVPDTILEAVIKNTGLHIVKEKTFPIQEIKGNSTVSRLARLDIADIVPGLYSIEYRLLGKDNLEITKALELFYIEK